MSEEAENRATIEAFWQAYNDERIDDCTTMYAPEARLRHPSSGIDVSGRAIRDLMHGALTAVPGRRSRVVNILSAGNAVVTENHFEGTTAESGQPVAVDMCYIFQFLDGKVVDQPSTHSCFRRHDHTEYVACRVAQSGAISPQRSSVTSPEKGNPERNWLEDCGRAQVIDCSSAVLAGPDMPMRARPLPYKACGC
jgi:ketosteroid isomerase-like protein